MKRFLTRVREWLNIPSIRAAQAAQATTAQQIDALRHEVGVLRSALLDRQGHVVGENLGAAGLAARAARLARERTQPAPDAPRQRSVAYEDALERLKALNPAAFPVWLRLFENGARSYTEERLGSCSHREHYYARLFAAYVEVYGHGQILDVGCGQYGLPAYLATRDPARVCGLEPLPMLEQPAFTVLRGFNECLPWADGQFDTVLSGTSLDHVLSLEVSLQEVCRVLRPGGHYLVWLASIPGSAAWDEQKTEVEAIDDFHLFHFDRAWIEPVFERHFEIADVTVIPQPGFDHVFYCLTPRRTQGA